MSWQLVSFLILAAVLVGGFAWYERSRPSAQIVALVAALAALAIAGRIAFAAFPNVKPTTDIVIVAGYALGAAPGFAVGALAALVSNFWFGQGPWTPWQMAGWGMCGVLGAALAAFRPRPGRLLLALVCGLAGLAYGALLNFSLMATYGGDLSWQRYLALLSRAVPFDLAHAIGNAVLAFVAGPAMIRMLVRFRERSRWRRGPALATGAVASLLVLAAAVPAEASAADPERAATWLIGAQNADGGWGASPDRDSAPDITAWAMLGLAATGRNPQDVAKGGANPVGYLRANVGKLRTPGDLARTIVALHAAGVKPRSFGGRDLIADLLDLRRSNGSYEGWPGSTAFAIIALRVGGAGGQAGPSIKWLTKVQNPDGGWGDVPGSPSTPDGTGIAMQAIPDTDAARKGLEFLRASQRPSGGFALGGFAGVNSQSTAWAALGIRAVGTDPGSVRAQGKSPLDYLSARQAGDGQVRYSPSSDQTPIWVTAQTLPAIAGHSLPIAAPPRKRKPQSSPAQNAPAPSVEGGAPQLPSAPPPSTGAPSTPSPGPSPPGGESSPSPLPSAPPLGEDALPPTGAPPTGELPEAVAEPAPPFEASERPGPKPWAPAGVGLASTGLALGGVLFLGRRFGW